MKSVSSCYNISYGGQADIGKCLQFNQWINECNLMEVTTAGTKFTWRGPQWNGRDRVFKKLDRVLCNVSWRLKYHDGFAKVLPMFNQITILLLFFTKESLMKGEIFLSDLKLHGILMRIFHKFFRKIGLEEEIWCFS
jgi:hypothetical protein